MVLFFALFVNSDQVGPTATNRGWVPRLRVASGVEPVALDLAVEEGMLIYSWYDRHNELDHLVVAINPWQYPEVSGWGEVRPGTSNESWVERGWTWSAKDNEYIAKEYPDAVAWLLHINGGIVVSSY
ncbi:MAG TPA: hypothetical protein VME46_04095 [Acidimicrobiales bacterium]|nr:hypothetical protein [Acidimicrobiales bacterium]